MSVKCKIFFFLIGAFLSQVTNGQNRIFISLKKITQLDGLSSYNVTKIIQDHYGFFWIGTQDGLNRSDGKSIVKYGGGSGGRYNLFGNNVTDIFEDTLRNIIWVSTSYGGINGIDTKTLRIVRHFTLFDNNRSISNKWIHCLKVVGDVIWIGTYGGLYFYNIKEDKFEVFVSQDFPGIDFKSLDVNKMMLDEFGRIWACCNNAGIFIIDSKLISIRYYLQLTELQFRLSQKSLVFWDIVNGLNSEVFIATSLGLRRIQSYSDKRPFIDKKFGLFRNTPIFSCSVDKTSFLWISANNKLFRYDFHNSRLSEFSDADFTSSNWQSTIYQIYVDSENHILFGCQEGIAIYENTRKPFVSYFKSSDSETKIQHAFTLFPMSDTVVLCGAQNGVYKVNTNSYKIENIENGGSCFLICRNWKGKVFWSNSNGINSFDKKGSRNLQGVFPLQKFWKNDILNSYCMINDSLVIVGSQMQKGVYMANIKSAKGKYLDYLGLCNNVVNTIFKDRNNRVWILSQDRVIQISDSIGKSQVFWFKDRKGLNLVSILNDMCETSDNYWFAAYGTGLIQTDRRLKIKKIISIKDGLCNNGVYKVLPFNDTLIIVTSNNGLSVLNINTNKIKNYFKSDGLQSNAFEEFCAIKMNNRIYAGGVNGFTIIDPQYFTTNTTPPKFYFTNIKTEATDGARDTSNLEMGELKIPDTWLQTNVSFIGLNYANPERVTYQYRLIGQNNSWVSLGTQNFVNIIGLSPGKYILEVKAANEDGVWCESKKLTLIFLPKWYQTLWFDFAVAMAVIGLLYGFFRYRISQLKKQQQIRAEIASDLHDDIGSALNTVKVFTHLAKRDEDKMKHINQIEDSVTQAAIGLRDMLWILDDSQDTVQEMLERIKKFALPVAMANGITLECINDAANDSQQISSKTKKRNLLLIAKESINNSIKYADCKNITVTLSQKSNKVTLVIKDDGKGFDMAVVQKGYGLNNIVLRAKQIKAVAEIESLPGQGTKVTVKQ